ncbi:unnamed protein product [Auanema sp. JU1783]|nr:unnamed protein product [Auanema sp. JU1783]
MTAKDKTEIGERGATLSGGQKARISLARALFAHKDIYLLDDVLASLDKNVADRIFEDAVQNALVSKTVVLVSSDPQRLALCSKVVFMENGRVVSYGPHLDLLESCKAYNDYCMATKVTEQYNTNRPESNNTEPRVVSSASEDFEKLAEDATLLQGSTSDLIALEKDNGKLVDDEEDLGLAEMSWKIYKNYIKAAGSWVVWCILIMAFILNVVSSIFSTFWLSRWLKNREEVVVQENGTIVRSSGSLAQSPDTSYYATIYGVSLVILFVSGLFKACIFVKVSLNAASRLHSNMFNSVIRGAVHFFDSTPTGRILNRFSKDMDEIDVKLPFTAEVFLQNMITCIGFLLVIAWVFPSFLIACVPLLAIFVMFILCFRAGIRSLKRSENISRSPLFDHITTSLEGLHCIHSYGQTSHFLETLKKRLDANSGSVFMFQSAMRWLAVWLDLFVVAITSVVAFLIVMLTGTVSPAEAGMAIAFAVQMSGIFQFAVRTQTELEAKMTSVERVAHYSDVITSEGDWDSKKGTDIPKDWPKAGQITFESVKLRYRPKLPLALNCVSFDIKPKEKIGIIGRTGSGKSSLGNVIYRLYPLTSGAIYIDGVDIVTLGLHRLRRAMAVIPQEPMLFAGTIRYNLDPNNQFSDSELWTALEKVYMKATIKSLEKGLEAEVQSGGENFSVGERQLLCMARAILTKARVVLLDEATASLDLATDKVIQKVIKEAFNECTLLLIAHRLENVYNCDRVLMMENGEVVEFDKPSVLLNRTTSAIHELSLAGRGDEIMVSDDDGEGTPVRLEAPESADGESAPEIIDNENDSGDGETEEIVDAAKEDDVIVAEDSTGSQDDVELIP